MRWVKSVRGDCERPSKNSRPSNANVRRCDPAGLRYREIAEIFGINTSSVGPLVQRAMARLSEELSMSEILHLPESSARAPSDMLSQFVDGDLAAEQSAWLGTHLDTCTECAAALAAFMRIDRELTAWGESLNSRNPPPPGAREQLAAKLALPSATRKATRWMPAAVVAVIAAGLVLAVIAPHKKPPVVARQAASPFIEIPYLLPLDPHENATIVRMNIRVETLIAAGYRVTADPDTIVPADVLVGEDGRAHAVRVLSGIEWNGTGD